MKIRKAKKGDEKDLAELFRQFWETHKDIDPLIEPAKKQNFLEEAKQAIKKKQKNRFFIIAEIDRKIVGYKEFFIKKQDKFFKVKKYGYLDSTVVHKDYRRKGIAKNLTEKALKVLKKKRIKYIKSNVYVKNKIAMDTWISLGFEPLSTNLIRKLK